MALKAYPWPWRAGSQTDSLRLSLSKAVLLRDCIAFPVTLLVTSKQLSLTTQKWGAIVPQTTRKKTHTLGHSTLALGLQCFCLVKMMFSLLNLLFHHGIDKTPQPQEGQ